MSVKSYEEMSPEQKMAYAVGYREARRQLLERACRVCAGLGAIDGFWLGTTKTCPACHGKGRQ